MSSEFIVGLKKNKYLLGFSALLIVAGVVFGFRGGEQVDDTIGETVPLPTVVDPNSVLGQNLNQDFQMPFQNTTPRRTKNAESAVARFEKIVEESEDEEEVATAMFRIGNINYSILYDYDNAVFYYQKFIDEFPNHVKALTAYACLADSYHKMDNLTDELQVYKTMMQSLPKDSDGYAWAEAQLDQGGIQ